MSQWPNPKMYIQHFSQKQRHRACSDLWVNMWWSLRMNFQWRGHQQFYMVVNFRFQWNMTSVIHLRGINLMGKQLAKVSLISLVLFCAKFSLTISFTLLYIFIYFKQMVRLWISLVWTEVQIQSSYKIKFEADLSFSRILGTNYTV